MHVSFKLKKLEQFSGSDLATFSFLVEICMIHKPDLVCRIIAGSVIFNFLIAEVMLLSFLLVEFSPCFWQEG